MRVSYSQGRAVSRSLKSISAAAKPVGGVSEPGVQDLAASRTAGRGGATSASTSWAVASDNALPARLTGQVLAASVQVSEEMTENIQVRSAAPAA